MLDGLRGAAALAVVYVHYLFLTGVSDRPGGGQVGVLVFFVLSGYLITRGLWRRDSRANVTTYRRFVRRRVSRLFPAMFGVVIFAAPVMALTGPEDARQALQAALIALSQTTAFFHAAGEMPVDGWLHTWSLTVEWVFYLSWPLAIIALQRRGATARRASAVALGLGCLLWAVSLPLAPLPFYVLPVANLGVMLVGASLALGHASQADGEIHRGREGRVSDFAFLLFALMVFLPSNTSGLWLYRVTLFPAAVIAAYFIIDQRPGTDSMVKRILESHPMATLGLVSYSLYLWHIPILWIAWWSLPSLAPAVRVLIALAALVPVVFLSFTYLEKPWLHIVKQEHARRRLPRLVSAPRRGWSTLDS